MSVTLRDFQPINTWSVNVNSPKFRNTYEPSSLTDHSTGRGYLNEDKSVVRIKCALLTIGTPIVHTIAATVNIAIRLMRLITLSHFSNSKSFKASCMDASYDLAKILASPVAIVALEIAAIYGIFRPYDGRKLYATIERATYGSSILAPCFQPNANYHLFGGNINAQNAF